MKIIIAIGFAILAILTIEVAQYQARYNNTRFNGTRFNSTRFNSTRFINTRFNSSRWNKGSFGSFNPTFSIGFIAPKSNPAKGNSTVFGQIRPYDKLIYQEEVYEKAKTFRKAKRIVTLPNALKLHFKEISAINITDLLRNGKNGTPSLIKGGPGQNNATVEFKSKSGWPMKFLVQFFGI